MESVGNCFVCDCKLGEKDNVTFSRVKVAQTISNLLGDGYVIVINEEDRLCRICNSLVSRVGRLDKIMSEANGNLLTLLQAKHSACPQMSKNNRPGRKVLGNEHERKEYGACYVCDGSLRQVDIKPYKRSDVAQVITNLLGGKYLVTVGEQDYLCQLCLSLSQRLFRVGGELQPSKASLLVLLRAKYSISASDQQHEVQKVEAVTPLTETKKCKTVSASERPGVQILELPSDESAEDLMSLPCQIQSVTSLTATEPPWDQRGNTTTVRREEVEEINCESPALVSLTTNNDQSESVSLPCESFLTLNSDGQIVEVILSSSQSIESVATLADCESNFAILTSSEDQLDGQCVILPYSDNIAGQTIDAFPISSASGSDAVLLGTVVNTDGNVSKKRPRYETSDLVYIENHTKTFCDKSVSTDDLPGSLYFKGERINSKTIGCQVSESDLKENFFPDECEVAVGLEPEVNNPTTNTTQVSINISIGTEEAVDFDYYVNNSNDDIAVQNNNALNQGTESNCVSEKSSSGICVRYSCAKCKFESSTYDELKTHVKNPGNGNVCKICDIGFHRKSNLSRHMNQHSPQSESRECQHCGAQLHDTTHYRFHYRWTHKPPDKQMPFCTDCNIGFTYKGSLRHHLVTVHGRNLTFPCTLCDRVFVDAIKFDKHVSFYHRESHNCKYCGKQEEDIEKLFLHEKRNHHNVSGDLYNVGQKVWQLTCRYCKKKFKTKMEREAHSVQCKLRFSFSCGECGKAFTNNQSLKHHKNNNCSLCHQYQCEQCGALFGKLAQLRHHLTRRHPGPQPHACHTCHKRFDSRRSLMRHRRCHAPAYYTFCCKVCKRSFSNAKLYVSHVVRKHKDYSVLEEVGYEEEENATKGLSVL